MQKPYSEGVATHTGLKSCGCLRKETPEALTGVHAGWVLSREIIHVTVRSVDAVVKVGRQHGECRYRKASSGSAWSETPCTHGNFLRRNWEIPWSTLSGDGDKVRTANPQGARR
jgi:RNA-directed DNA polymerase